MFGYKAVGRRAEAELKAVRKLEAELKEARAQLDYIAMMCEVEVLDFAVSEGAEVSEVEGYERDEQSRQG